MIKNLLFLTKDTAQVSDYDGNPVERQAYTAELDLSDIGKGTYPTTCLKKLMNSQQLCVN